MSAIVPIQRLNLDCLRHILSYLERKDKARVREVCKIWKQAIDQGGASVWLNDARNRFMRGKFFFPQPHLLTSNSLQDLTTRASAAAAAATTTSSATNNAQEEESLDSEQVVEDMLLELNKPDCSYQKLFRLCRQALFLFFVKEGKGHFRSRITNICYLKDLLNEPWLAHYRPFGDTDEVETQVAALLHLLNGLRAEFSTIRDCAAAETLKLITSLYDLSMGGDVWDFFRQAEIARQTTTLVQYYVQSFKDAPQECVKILDFFADKLPLLQCIIARAIPPCAGKTAIFNALAQNVVNVDPNFDWKSAVCGIAHRVFYDEDVNKIGILLRRCSSDDENWDEKFPLILQLSYQFLRGLIQFDPNVFREPDPGDLYFSGLSNHFGNPKYKYASDLKSPAWWTSWWTLRRAAVLYLILGFESESPIIRSIALTFLKRLARDYHDSGKSESSAQNKVYKRILFAVCRGFLMSPKITDAKAVATIRKVFRNNTTLLNAFIKFLPPSPKNTRLQATMDLFDVG